MSASDRLPRTAAVALAIVGAALIVISALIWGAGGFRPLPTSFARGALGVSAGFVAALSYLGAGSLLASRIPRNPIGWLLLTMGLTFATMTPTALLVDAAHHAFRPAPAATLVFAWFISSFSGPVLAGSAITAGLLFPTGRPAGRRWWWAIGLAIVGAGLLAIGIALRPGGLIWYPTLANPFAASASFWPLATAAVVVGCVALFAATALVVVSLAGRYRRGDTTLRAQLRWVLYAGALQPAIVGPFLLVRFVASASEALGEVLLASANTTMALVPIAATVAITRYRLFGIDLIINRTLVYAPTVAILGGLYTASIAIFQRLFVAVTGETSDAPLVITIFLVAAAFTPVRKALEGWLERWIGRPGAASPQPSHLAGGQPSEPSSVAMEPAVAEVAAGVIALRRLEGRFAEASTPPLRSGGSRRLAIDAEARVACPDGGRPHFTACLACQYFGALVTAPATVVCTAPAAAPRRGS